MNSVFFVAWSQLSHHKMKLVAATAGVVVAVMLMLVQLGIRRGAMDNSVAFTKRIQADLVVLSPRSRSMFQSSQFPRRLLYRLPGSFGVERVEPIYMGTSRWRNPWVYNEHPILIYGIDPRRSMIDLPGFNDRASELELADRVLFDNLSRVSYGPVADTLKESQEPIKVEIGGRKVEVIGGINVGISISNDGNLYTTPGNFHRLLQHRNPSSVDVGLIKLEPGIDATRARQEIQIFLGREVRVLKKDELVESEVNFMRETAPIDFIFGMGAVIGFFIGFVVVYQILYTEVTNHLPQLATMKAIGFTDFYLLKLVLSQAFILSLIGYIPGFLLALALYDVATDQIQMPFKMTWERAIGIYLLTLLMCSLSAAVAVRKAWTANPAEVF